MILNNSSEIIKGVVTRNRARTDDRKLSISQGVIDL